MNGAPGSGAPLVRDVVLVGGGHSHALLVRRWAMRPLAGVRLTLVSRDVLTPYSGMLPGLIAGHYTFDEVHIDLLRLCAWAGVRFVRAEVAAIDPERREIRFAADSSRPPLGWDLLSLDTGSTPDLSVPGAREHSTPVKPVSAFHARWQAALARAGAEPLSIGVVGSGAGGFELIMAMRHALPVARARCHWVMRGELPLGDRPEKVGERALAAARRAGVTVHVGFDVVRVGARRIEASDGRSLALDETLWCTAASGPDWPAAAGLATDERGFVLTDRHLRSVSHPRVFATGDIGTQRDTPSAKAGVFAVRQAPVLFENLRRTLLGEPLARYAPQRDFLTLMATGGRSAIASRGPFVLEGARLWRWKDRIDRRFMARFAELPAMNGRALPPIVPNALLNVRLSGDAATSSDTLPRNAPSPDTVVVDAPAGSLPPGASSASPSSIASGGGMRCRGCGAKVGVQVLEETLAALPGRPRDDVLAGFETGGDAALLDTGGHLLLQSVDQLDAIVDDPWLFGRIATLHAVSDVLTGSATVHSVQALATLPAAHERVTRRDLEQLMHGVLDALSDGDVALVGGHTAEGEGLALGLVVNALRERDGAPPQEVGPGNALVLTQAIGVGTLFAALMRTRARGVDVQRALDVMSTSNRAAAEILRAHGAKAMTDVTGFGLAGHLRTLLRGSASRARLDVAAVPLLPGAFAAAEAGVHSSAWPASGHALADFDGVSRCPLPWRRLLCDPQTGGGMLAPVPRDEAERCVDALRGAGYDDAAIVGRLVEAPRHALRVPADTDP